MRNRGAEPDDAEQPQDPTTAVPVATVQIPEGWEPAGMDPTEELEAVGALAGTQAVPAEAGDIALTQTGVPMSWLQRHSGAVVGVLGALVLLSLALVAVLFGRLGDTEDDLVQARVDLERVEAGAALYASQVTGFQEQLLELEPTIAGGLDEAIAGLEEFAASTIEFDVNIDEQVQIDTQVVLDRELQVPINETLPIKESFETRIEVETPLGFSVPLDVTVPVDIDVPIDLDLDIAVNETIPVSASVPVKLDIPIAIAVGETQLADLAESLAQGLRSLQGVLSGLGG